MAVDFANVNISLAEFQGISSGKYNAGEVKLASETKLGKINNHVHFQGSNATPLSHEEVLAVKNAFVKALSSNGVAADEIAKIRRELGLSAETGIDKTLHARSIRPLTCQQVRDILDRNAAAINAHADQNPGAARISTSAQIYGEGGMRADRAATRNEVNAALAGAGGTEEHEGIALAEAVISGDVNAEELGRIGGVDFATYDDRPIAQIINDPRPENKNKYVKAKFAIPERFRLAIDVGPSLVADLK